MRAGENVQVVSVPLEHVDLRRQACRQCARRLRPLRVGRVRRREEPERGPRAGHARPSHPRLEVALPERLRVRLPARLGRDRHVRIAVGAAADEMQNAVLDVLGARRRRRLPPLVRAPDAPAERVEAVGEAKLVSQPLHRPGSAEGHGDGSGSGGGGGDELLTSTVIDALGQVRAVVTERPRLEVLRAVRAGRGLRIPLHRPLTVRADGRDPRRPTCRRMRRRRPSRSRPAPARARPSPRSPSHPGSAPRIRPSRAGRRS